MDGKMQDVLDLWDCKIEGANEHHCLCLPLPQQGKQELYLGGKTFLQDHCHIFPTTLPKAHFSSKQKE